jgi:hypothetical protein
MIGATETKTENAHKRMSKGMTALFLFPLIIKLAAAPSRSGDRRVPPPAIIQS